MLPFELLNARYRSIIEWHHLIGNSMKFNCLSMPNSPSLRIRYHIKCSNSLLPLPHYIPSTSTSPKPPQFQLWGFHISCKPNTWLRLNWYGAIRSRSSWWVGHCDSEGNWILGRMWRILVSTDRGIKLYYSCLTLGCDTERNWIELNYMKVMYMFLWSLNCVHGGINTPILGQGFQAFHSSPAWAGSEELRF